jgi:hypothetical protein
LGIDLLAVAAAGVAVVEAPAADVGVLGDDAGLDALAWLPQATTTRAQVARSARRIAGVQCSSRAEPMAT